MKSVTIDYTNLEGKRQTRRIDALIRREVAEAQIQALLANVFEPAVDTV